MAKIPNASRKLQDRADRKSQKRNEKKLQIANSAIEALKTLGYANTTLRDIAARTDTSIGILHYYFEDKAELILYCVKTYKEDFIGKIDAIIDSAASSAELVTVFPAGLATTILERSDVHRLWYDMRAQATFDETFVPTVKEIERGLIELVRRAALKLDDARDPEILYAALDGVFRYYVQKTIYGEKPAREEIVATFAAMLQPASSG